ncbi:MAG: hypothetical protein ACI9PC_001620, partial [Porticoccaceae bacterium]
MPLKFILGSGFNGYFLPVAIHTTGTGFRRLITFSIITVTAT